MSEATKPNIFPLVLPTTEVLSDLRLEAYHQVAKELGGVSIQIVAEPGDIMVVAGSGAPSLGNFRDQGTLLGVMVQKYLNTQLLTEYRSKTGTRV